jgi:hypothetical protein
MAPRLVAMADRRARRLLLFVALGALTTLLSLLVQLLLREPAAGRGHRLS